MPIETTGLPQQKSGDPDAGGQSGATQGLSPNPEADAESVEELVESGQGYEAGIVEGVEDSADHPEEPLSPREG